MLTNKQLNEIREHLDKAQNPVFLYDNDADGLCSYIILRKFLGRGKGMAVRSYPDLNVQYAKRIQDMNADYIFVLDKPVLSKEFAEEVDSMQIPLVWIDHHDTPVEDFERKMKTMYVYNSARNKGKNKSNEPITFVSYQIVERKEDIWLALVGCISDHYLPKFSKDFAKTNPELWGNVKEPFDAYFGTEIGRIAQSLNFGLKDSVRNVEELQNFLISCRTPGEVLSEIDGNQAFRDKYMSLKKKYDSLLVEAMRNVSGKLIFFEYGGEMSISSEISNELSYRNKGKYVIVVYVRGSVSNISIRGKGVRKILEKILPNLTNASGGGHDNAVGAKIRTEELETFRELFEKEIK